MPFLSGSHGRAGLRLAPPVLTLCRSLYRVKRRARAGTSKHGLAPTLNYSGRLRSTSSIFATSTPDPYGFTRKPCDHIVPDPAPLRPIPSTHWKESAGTSGRRGMHYRARGIAAHHRHRQNPAPPHAPQDGPREHQSPACPFSARQHAVAVLLQSPLCGPCESAGSSSTNRMVPTSLADRQTQWQCGSLPRVVRPGLQANNMVKHASFFPEPFRNVSVSAVSLSRFPSTAEKAPARDHENLGAKEGIEDARLRGGIHADAVVWSLRTRHIPGR